MEGRALWDRPMSRAEYDALIDQGVLDTEDRVELLGGRLMVAEPKGADHYTATRRIARALEMAFGAGWDVRVEGPIALDDDSEPEPDVAVVRGTLDDYRDAHPSRPVLTVEVARSSLASDRSIKGSLYARAGLAEYWVLDLARSVLEVYRDPVAHPAAPFGWRYASREDIDASGHVTPQAAPGTRIPIARLLP